MFASAVLQICQKMLFTTFLISLGTQGANAPSDAMRCVVNGQETAAKPQVGAGQKQLRPRLWGLLPSNLLFDFVLSYFLLEILELPMPR